jgi:hypothetical protein
MSIACFRKVYIRNTETKTKTETCFIMFHYNAYTDRGRLSRERELSTVAWTASHFSFLRNVRVFMLVRYTCKVWYVLGCMSVI